MSLDDKKYPLVSVAIITYNQKKFLEEAIESVLSQDYPNMEIVVADDCSDDGSQELLKNYDSQYPNKFKLVLADKNSGVTANCNRAQSVCSGKYIAWFAGDDLMLPGKIKKQVDFMEKNPECTICYHDLDVFDDKTNKTMYRHNFMHKPRTGDFKVCIAHGSFNGACSNMIRRQKAPARGFCPELHTASDTLYWIECLENGGTINYIPEVLARHRRHEDNVTNSVSAYFQNHLDALACCNMLLAKYPSYAKIIIRNYAVVLRGIRLKPQVADYKGVLLGTLRINFSIKVVAALLCYFLSFGRVKL